MSGADPLDGANLSATGWQEATAPDFRLAMALPARKILEEVGEEITEKALPAVTRAAQEWGEAGLKKGGLYREGASEVGEQAVKETGKEWARQAVLHRVSETVEKLPASILDDPKALMSTLYQTQADTVLKTGIGLAGAAAGAVALRQVTEEREAKRSIWDRFSNAVLGLLSLDADPSYVAADLECQHRRERLLPLFTEAENTLRRGWTRQAGDDLTEEEEEALSLNTSVQPQTFSATHTDSTASDAGLAHDEAAVMAQLEALVRYAKARDLRDTDPDQGHSYLKYLILIAQGKTDQQASEHLNIPKATLSNGGRDAIAAATGLRGANSIVFWAWQNEKLINQASQNLNLGEDYTLEKQKTPLNLPLALTERETSVLLLKLARFTETQICERLFIGPSTVRTLISDLSRKIGASSFQEALAIVFRTRFLEHEHNYRLVPADIPDDPLVHTLLTKPQVSGSPQRAVLTRPLTYREATLFRRVLDGEDMAEIARQEGIQYQTIRKIFTTIGHRLGTSDVGTALAIVKNHSMLSDPRNIALPSDLQDTRIVPLVEAGVQEKRFPDPLAYLRLLIDLSNGYTVKEIAIKQNLPESLVKDRQKRLYNLWQTSDIEMLIVQAWKARETLNTLMELSSEEEDYNLLPVESETTSSGRFSTRQQEIATLMMSGQNSQEIAATLNLSLGQIRKALQEMREITGTHTTIQLLVRLLEEELAENPQ
jgi:DNA-binding NarL/FixJ family response regulator